MKKITIMGFVISCLLWILAVIMYVMGKCDLMPVFITVALICVFTVIDSFCT